jgi:Domain of unknown function (DUF5916)
MCNPFRLLLAVFCLLLTTPLMAQVGNPKTIPAKRTTQIVKIDGKLDEPAWKDAAPATGFTELRPNTGSAENPANKSELWFMYSNEGIYIGGFFHEQAKDSIATELVGRDGFGNNDFVGVIFDTYKDQINGFEYFLTPLGEQWDAKLAPANNGNDEDFSWNAVWQSGTQIHDNGWSFEFFLPYAAIRFGKKQVQDWGLNIVRMRRKSGQQLFWNPINPQVNGFLTQAGRLTGLENIKPPVRLQFSPYFSFYGNHFRQPAQKSFTTQVNGGMDVKYGLNQAFTLDMTLIPDFGQVQSDNQVLNLTPFEVRFNENRNFFTEGTELFSKGNLFYSRRIGGSPLHLWDVQAGANERIVKNPTESKLINATKVSGRAQNGLGIGFLNAVTHAQYATIENTNTKEQYKMETDPLTNYNVLVLDKTMKHNSSVTLVNTNVWRSGKDYDANVTAALFDINDKTNTWNLSGKAAVSQLLGYLPNGKNESGYSQALSFGKTSGRLNFNVFQELTDTRYTHRDLGYFTNNNFLDHGFWMGYRWLKPGPGYNRIFLNLNGWHSKLLTPFPGINETYQNSGMNANGNVQLKNLWWLGGNINANFGDNDFYEPRWSGWYFHRNPRVGMGLFVNSNEAKKYSFNAELFGRKFIDFYKARGYELGLRQNFRFNNKFSVTHRANWEVNQNNMGYAWSQNESQVVFARRQVNTIENILFLKYNFNNKMGLTMRTRHYLSSVANKEFFNLRKDGRLDPNPAFNQPLDRNVNFFNIDMVYTWQFAPGSFINLVWKNAIADFRSEVERDYFRNLGRTLEADQNNNISLKVIYFLDYLQLKKKKG